MFNDNQWIDRNNGKVDTTFPFGKTHAKGNTPADDSKFAESATRIGVSMQSVWHSARLLLHRCAESRGIKSPHTHGFPRRTWVADVKVGMLERRKRQAAGPMTGSLCTCVRCSSTAALPLHCRRCCRCRHHHHPAAAPLSLSSSSLPPSPIAALVIIILVVVPEPRHDAACGNPRCLQTRHATDAGQHQEHR